MVTEDKKDIISLLPKQIILCRHIDKGKDKSKPGASVRGLARANYIAGMFLTPNPIFEVPTMIYVFRKKNRKGDKLLNRSMQSAAPLIQAGHYKPEQVNSEFDNSDADTLKMIDNMFSAHNSGKVIICFWEHKILPKIVREIGKRMGKDKPVFKDFCEWNEKPWKGKDDPDLYSLTVVINIGTASLIGINQSNNYSKDGSMLYAEPSTFTNILFKM